MGEQSGERGQAVRTFDSDVMCDASGCLRRLKGQPVRHRSANVGAGSSWGPACGEHENWHPVTTTSGGDVTPPTKDSDD